MSWPTLEALKQALDVKSDDWDGEHHLQGVLDAAIANVKLDVGDWDDEADEPDAKLSRAAIRERERRSRSAAKRSERAEAKAAEPTEAKDEPKKSEKAKA